jgi:antitoxin component of RelBE/YafQ-DinJ toxin-antitoxin module
MPSTVQLNTRIDPGLKARGDAVFARVDIFVSRGVAVYLPLVCAYARYGYSAVYKSTVTLGEALK